MRESRFWGLHMLSAVVILVFLGLHMALMHLDGTLALFDPSLARPLDWDRVLARARSAFFTVSYLFLLAAALFHGLYGLRTMIYELTESAAVRRAVSLVFTAGGLLLFGVGAWAVIAMHRGAAA